MYSTCKSYYDCLFLHLVASQVNLVSGLLVAPASAESDDEDKFNVFLNGQKGLHLILSLATVYPGQ